jgi:putative DNA primase/helicase
MRNAKRARATFPYLKRKGIQPTNNVYLTQKLLATGGCRSQWRPNLTGENVLVFPISQPDGTISSVQLIDADGKKAFLPGGRIKGGVWSSGPFPEGDGTGQVFHIGEGCATVVSAAQAAGQGIAVAAMMDSQLPNIAKALRERFPAADIVLLADLLPDGTPNRHAVAAAQAVGGRLLVPDFGPGRLENQKDVNDLLVHRGAAELANQLAAATVPEALQANAVMTMTRADAVAVERPPEQCTITVDRQLSDLSNAQLFAAQHHGRIRFVHGQEVWLIWDGVCWQRDETGGIERLAKTITGRGRSRRRR